eukprot:SAG22_NODE_803_length_7098_cov_2.856408_6_plen_169_part_00
MRRPTPRAPAAASLGPTTAARTGKTETCCSHGRWQPQAGPRSWSTAGCSRALGARCALAVPQGPASGTDVKRLLGCFRGHGLPNHGHHGTAGALLAVSGLTARTARAERHVYVSRLALTLPAWALLLPLLAAPRRRRPSGAISGTDYTLPRYATDDRLHHDRSTEPCQ